MHPGTNSVRELAKIPLIQIDPHWNSTTEIANVVIPTAICGIEAEGTAYRMDGVSLRLRKMIESKHLDDEEVLEKITSRVKKIGHSLRGCSDRKYSRKRTWTSDGFNNCQEAPDSLQH